MKYILIVAILLVTIYSYAQNDLVRYRPCSSGCGSELNTAFNYDDSTTFATPDVISDYVVRKTIGTRFHQAIDYTVQGEEDRGYDIVAIGGGKISKIEGGEIYKTISVGSYKYTHIFQNEIPLTGKFIKSGKFIMKKVEPKLGLISIPWAIIDLEYCRAFCEEADRTIVIPGLENSFCGSNTFTTINEVEVGWDIAPIGDSKAPQGTHLHLERVTGGTKHDPNQFMQHDSQDFGMTLTTKDNTNIESKFWLGGNHNTPVYPSDWNKRDFGSWTQTGTYPYAHNDASNQIYDDYFFADFYTIIHKTNHKKFADFPSDARYNDGKYKLKTTVTNVQDELFTIPGADFMLDNFQPYLTKIEVSSNNSDLYEISRNGIDADLKVANNGIISNSIGDYSVKLNLIFTYPLTVEIRTSEPMQNMICGHRLKIGSTVFQELAMTKSSSDKLKWTVNI